MQGERHFHMKLGRKWSTIRRLLLTNCIFVGQLSWRTDELGSIRCDDKEILRNGGNPRFSTSFSAALATNCYLFKSLRELDPVDWLVYSLLFSYFTSIPFFWSLDSHSNIFNKYLLVYVLTNGYFYFVFMFFTLIHTN